MAKKEEKAKDPQEENLLTAKKTFTPEGASDIKNVLTEFIPEPSVKKNQFFKTKKDTNHDEKIDYSSFSMIELISELEKLTKQDNWFNQGKNIQELSQQFERKFKNETKAKKDEFIKEGGNEIDFYFRPNYKNDFDQILRDHKKKKRSFFLEREQTQKLNLEKKLEIIENLKNLINVDENINAIYKKFRNLQEIWHKTGPVQRALSNNIWQTFKHHTEIFYDFLHLNRELRDLDFKHNYEEKIKIINQAEKLSEISDIIKASRDLNILHRLWKNDLGPVAKEHREELWTRFQKASHVIHNRRQEFDKEYDIILEDNLNKKNELIIKMENIKNSSPKNHTEWKKSIENLNKIREEFKLIGQVTKKHSKLTWTRFREISREINREKNNFYKSQKTEHRKNIELKKALIKEVKDILEKEDWNEYANQMKKIQREWRSIGFIPRKLSDQLWEEFRSNCNIYFDRIKTGYEKISEKELEIQKKKEVFINSIKDFKIPHEFEDFKIFSANQWEEFINLGILKGNINKNLSDNYNKEFISIIDKSQMDINLKKEAKNHIRFFLIKDDEKELSKEIKSIKKKMDEIKSEVLQLENNMDYFSSSSNENPLLLEVSSKLKELKSAEQHLKEELVPLRKMKRELDNSFNESDIEEKSEENPN
ncbi:MAG: chromosome segregation protein [Flavobacteriaceae bacterium]|nr:chromosome segregation protein [Flavobacteriaceae bacterium]|tara:strand:+ start:97 stop:2049 length:1953 start_codon:yes stop_codon:yes gene_type:complete